MAVEDLTNSEAKLADDKRAAERSLERTNSEFGECKMKLSAAEGRIAAMELQIARAEGARRDVEFKLTAIHSHMRRTLGIGRDAAANLSSPGRKPQTETDRPDGDESL